jgi:hypothetical protein
MSKVSELTEEQREKKRAYERAWRKNRYDTDPEYRKHKRTIDRNWIRNATAKISAYKLEQGCKICSYNKCSRALHFHHRDSSQKEFSISSNIDRGVKAVWDEIAKCDIICSNCHSEAHCEQGCK